MRQERLRPEHGAKFRLQGYGETSPKLEERRRAAARERAGVGRLRQGYGELRRSYAKARPREH